MIETKNDSYTVMDQTFTIKRTREFTNHGNYFVLLEGQEGEQLYSIEDAHLCKAPNWTKTHIIITKTSGEVGMQIKRFIGSSKNGPFELAANPYAGVYLKPEEWESIYKSMGQKTL